jgi:UDP-N-acetylmuramoyl-L-alanyl-D-glutamate--2,6-diaminopimelate ligase
MLNNIKKTFQPFINIYHLFRSLFVNAYYGFPSRKLKVIGVTGTDGKTTTTHLIYHVLKESGRRVSMISTVYAKIAGEEYDTGFHVTTPDAALVAKFLKMAVDNKDEYFVLETTSHRLDQNQLTGIKFKAGVITNVTHEHLDYHKTYRNYVLAKNKLLKKSEIKIANADDESFPYFKARNSNLKSYGLKAHADFTHEFNGNITSFNKYNYLAAYSVCHELGLTDEEFMKAADTFELPKGRLETVYDKKFKVVIDFAHTPNAFLKLLPDLRKTYLKGKGRLIHVFGSAGLRDQTKRPLMGEASGEFSDRVILTEEDYRTEDAMGICQEIAKGLESKGMRQVSYDQLGGTEKVYSIILNREKAVRTAIHLAREGDVVVVTGKAHEKSLARGKVEYPYSEHEAVKKAIDSL